MSPTDRLQISRKRESAVTPQRTFLQQTTTSGQRALRGNSVSGGIMCKHATGASVDKHLRPTDLKNSSGRPLEVTTRRSMEREFSRDLSRIGTYSRAHTQGQAKLEIGRPGDRFEQEAEAAADRITGPSTNSRRASDIRDEVPKQHESVDFDSVRLHTDGVANAAATGLGAHALTIGNDIYFREGKYQPESAAGQRLLAHELTHTVQQRGNRPMVQAFWPELVGGVVGAVVGAATLASGGIAGIILGALAGGLAGTFLGMAWDALFGDDLDRTEPKDDGIAENDPEFREKWERFLREGTSMLTFGACQFPQGGAWKYDERYWERTNGQYLGYRPKGVSPAKAVDELFNNLERWEFDCALYPEVATLYAFRRTLGANRFNEKFKDLVLRTHHTSGLQRAVFDVDDMNEAQFNETWNNSPVGTKVMWSNRSSAADGTAWKNENAVKTQKAATWQDDRYSAYPLGVDMLEDQVKKGLAENATDYPKSATTSVRDKYVRDNIYRHQLQLLN